MLKKLLHEPLVHFLLIGAALFGLSAFLHHNQTEAGHTFKDANTIVIDDTVLRKIRIQYLHNTGREPTPSQMGELISQYIHTEMLYREALRIGLDQDNDSIKTLLAGQMNIAYAADEIPPPSDETLKQFYKVDVENYANDSGDTSEMHFQIIKPMIRNRYRYKEKQKHVAEKMKVLAQKYKVVKTYSNY